MKIEQLVWSKGGKWEETASCPAINPQIVFVFGDNNILRANDALSFLRSKYPGAQLFGGTSAYEISQQGFGEDSVVATAVEFRNPDLRLAKVPISESTNEGAAHELARCFAGSGPISHLLVLCDGKQANGSRFVSQLTDLLPGVPITGGMTADKEVARPSYLIYEGELHEGCTIAVAFGPSVRSGYGSEGGWDSFGIDRKITKSSGKCVYEVDGQPALELYKRYLGDEAVNLPYSAHYFPAFLKKTVDSHGRVRDVVRVDEAKNALIFAADMPQGWYFRLMKSNPEHLVEGAACAARRSLAGIDSDKAFLAILVSCVGRQIVMKKRVDDELDEASEVLGPNKVMCGFYSLGEICPSERHKPALFHNQTMTVTLLSDE